MKCSLKHAFVNILNIIIIITAPSEGVECPLLLHKSSITGEPINFRELKAALNRLQDLDSFPNNGNYENNLHRIVKKQMAGSDCGDLSKSERSIFTFPHGSHNSNVPEFQKSKKVIVDFDSSEDATTYPENDQQTRKPETLLEKIKNFSKQKRSVPSPPPKNKPQTDIVQNQNVTIVQENITKPETEGIKLKNSNTMRPLEEEYKKVEKELKNIEKLNTIINLEEDNKKIEKEIKKLEKPNATEASGEENKKEEKESKTAESEKSENKQLKKSHVNIPDQQDFRCYYELESSPWGCIKIKHKRCPDGQMFSVKLSKCAKTTKGKVRRKRHLNGFMYRRFDSRVIGNSPDDTDRSNEWLDATQGSKLPPEFKPVKKPELKVYHLMPQAKQQWNFTNTGVLVRKRDAVKKSESVKGDSKRDEDSTKGLDKRQDPKARRSKSFVIHIHKKDDNVAANEETENEDEENDDEDEEDDESDENEEEDEDAEEEYTDVTQKNAPSSKETIKDLIKSAKDAVTNRARFNDNTIQPKILQKSSSIQNKKSQTQELDSGNKKVLIDANIKVDSAISNALKCVLKGKAKGDVNNNLPFEDEALISDRGSQDQMDPELLRMYGNLLKHNPRVKRYYLAHRPRT